MSEFIIIQVGQCGNQIGSALWPRILQEYGIHTDHKKYQANKHSQSLLDESFSSFFWMPESKLNRKILETQTMRARVLCIDMEERVVSRYTNGPFKHLFDKKFLITSNSGCGNNWAEGYLTYGHMYKRKITNSLHSLVEMCDKLRGFLLLFSLGGGTGSGLGTKIVEILEKEYPHLDRLVCCVFPSKVDDVIIAPYNVALSTQIINKSATCIFPVDNKALMDISEPKFFMKKYQTSSSCPTGKSFEELNSIIVSMLLNLTSGSRFPGSLNIDLNELANNMVPFPRLNFVCSGTSPVLTNASRNVLKCDNLFTSCCSRNNQLVQIDPLQGVLLCSAFIGRGDIDLSDLRRNVVRFHKTARFAPWSKSAVKTGLCSIPPFDSPSSVLSLQNSSKMADLFNNTLLNFVQLYKRKAHVHHYLNVQNFDEEFFTESATSLEATATAYSDIEAMKPISVPRLNVL